MSEKSIQSDLSGLARAYDPPAEDFNPHTAPDELLLRHGLPRRPDPVREPSLAKIWQRVFARPAQFVKAELELDPIMSGRARKRASDPEYSIGDWAGVAVETSSLGGGGPATVVYGEWVVPTVSMLDPAGHDISVAFWVGIDGLNGVGDQILQAGIAATVESGFFSNDVTWWAWTEWYHNDAVTVSNFPVQPGDSLSVLVCAPQPDQGYITMMNHSQGFGTAVNVKPPKGVTSLGASVEWVAEQVSDDLPYFYAMRFNECYASTQSRLFDLEPNGIPLAMRNFSISTPWGHVIAQGGTEWPTVAAVRWEAFS